jgi:hypothetical protein
MARDTVSAAKKSWLVLTNAIMMVSWIRVLRVTTAFCLQPVLLGGVEEETQIGNCDTWREAVRFALLASFLELLNSLIGVTRSKPAQVLLFSVIRFGVEMVIAPVLASCFAWQHVMTVTCWSVDSVRFFCFLWDNLFPTHDWAKAVRYTVGPVVFPFGATGEMLMVIAAGSRQQTTEKALLYYGAACLWPAGFFPLFKQLLRQRRKFYQKKNKNKTQPEKKSI